MTVLAHVTLRGTSREQYDALRARTGWLDETPAGGLAHLTWWEDLDCHSLDAWESEAAFAAFGEQRLGPAMADLGLEGEPEVAFMAAHEIYLPEARTVAPTAPYSDDVETVRRGYAAFASGDIPAVLEMLDPRVDWYSPDTVRDGGRYTGPEGVAQFFGTLPSRFAEIAVEPETFLAGSHVVVVLGRHRARTTAGVAITLPFVHVWTMRGGKATGFTEHFDTVKLNTALSLVAQPTGADAGTARPDGEEVRTLLARIFDEVVNQGRIDVADELFAEDFLDHGPMGDVPGRAAFTQTVAQWRAAVPDVHCEVEQVCVDGDLAGWVVHTTGTHTGDDLGFPATGKRFETFSANVGRIRDGRAVEHWSEQGMLSMLGQVGVMAMPATSGT